MVHAVWQQQTLHKCSEDEAIAKLDILRGKRKVDAYTRIVDKEITLSLMKPDDD